MQFWKMCPSNTQCCELCLNRTCHLLCTVLVQKALGRNVHGVCSSELGDKAEEISLFQSGLFTFSYLYLSLETKL